jgi:hypothetical protein
MNRENIQSIKRGRPERPPNRWRSAKSRLVATIFRTPVGIARLPR